MLQKILLRFQSLVENSWFFLLIYWLVFLTVPFADAHGMLQRVDSMQDSEPTSGREAFNPRLAQSHTGNVVCLYYCLNVVLNWFFSRRELCCTSHLNSPKTSKLQMLFYLGLNLFFDCRRASYNEKVDMYSLGIIFFEMCVRFSTLSERFMELQVSLIKKMCDFSNKKPRPGSTQATD